MNIFEVFGLDGQDMRDSDGKIRENTNFFDGTLDSTPNAREDEVTEQLKILAQKVRGTRVQRESGTLGDIFLVSQLQAAEGVFIGAYGYNTSLNIFEVLLERNGGGEYYQNLQCIRNNINHQYPNIHYYVHQGCNIIS